MSPRVGRRRGTLLVVAGLAVASVVILLWTTQVSDSRASENAELQDAIHRLEMAVATSHLWLEEYLTGDLSVDDRRIYADLDEAIEVVRGLLGSDVDDVEQVRGVMREDAGLRAQFERLRSHITTFRAASQARYQHGAVAGVGSDLDQRFDQTFDELLGDAAGLRARLSSRMSLSQAITRMRLRFVILVWIVMAAAAVWGLWTYELRGQRDETDLRRRDHELQQARKMEAVGRLAGGIAHDINNYLGAVRGHCEVAKLKGESGEDLARRMDRVMTIVTKASALIRQLLAFSRRQPTQPQSVSLNEVVTGTRETLGHLLGEDISFDVRLADNLWPTVIDPSQAEQLLVNLLVNGRDAMPRGGTIVVATSNRSDPDAGQWVDLSVTDTGSGIPIEIREKIFEPFFSTKPEGQSSGLGLATVYAIVQQSGGRIDVDSQPGAGSTFTVLLPAHPFASRSLPGVEPELPASIGGIRVLLVEDDDAMRASTAELLGALGHEVRSTANGPEALGVLVSGNKPFELMISDVVMPGMSGPEVLRAARVREPNLACLFISGYADDVALQQGLDLDSAAFLAKPFDVGSLSRSISELIA